LAGYIFVSHFKAVEGADKAGLPAKNNGRAVPDGFYGLHIRLYQAEVRVIEKALTSLGLKFSAVYSIRAKKISHGNRG